MSAMERHLTHVIRTAKSTTAAAKSRLSASWRRSLIAHGLDPIGTAPPARLSDSVLSERQTSDALLLRVAQDELDDLFGLVALSGCAVLLTDRDGIVLDSRAPAGDRDTFRSWGLSPGFDWSEASEGTNGIGTCLADERPVVIHRDEHFLCRNTAMSCIDAPVFGADGEIVAALDVSSARADQTKTMNCLLAAAVERFAHRIETALFRAVYPTSRIVAGAPDRAPSLLAVDADDLVIGATRAARRTLGLPRTAAFAATPATDLLGQARPRSGIEGAEHAAIKRALARHRGNASAAARALGLSRATLYRRMARLGVDKGCANLSHI